MNNVNKNDDLDFLLPVCTHNPRNSVVADNVRKIVENASEKKRECFGKYVNSSSVCYGCEDEADCIIETLNIVPENKMKSKRMTKREYYLGIALAVSKRSTCLKRHYGCIIVKNDEIIATGYNGAPRGDKNCSDSGMCGRLNKPHNSGDYSDCPAVHAEQNAMLSASRKDMIGATLYLAGEERILKDCIDGYEKWVSIDCIPCPICERMIKNAGIKEVIG